MVRFQPKGFHNSLPSQENGAYISTMSDNKLVKSIMDATVLTGFTACIGCIAKKVVKANMTVDPSGNAMVYVMFTAVMAGNIALR